MIAWLRHAGGFVVKEVREVLRQPRLMVTLVLGPFLILLILGLGYRQVRPELRAVFVAPPDQTEQIREWAALVGNRLDLVDVVDDGTTAFDALARHELDVVAVFPSDPEQRVLQSRTVPITVYHAELDPFEEAYVRFVSELAATRINEEVLELLAAESQARTAGIAAALEEADAAATAFSTATDRADEAAARRERDRLATALDQVVAESANLAQLGSPGEAADVSGLQVASDLLRDDAASLAQQAAAVEAIDGEVSALEQQLHRARSIDPSVLVRPFRADIQTVAEAQPDVDDFYSPGVLSLLVQHLAITFAGLSLVAEDRLGALELLRVAPVRTSEMLAGKYVGYGLMTGVVAAVLGVATYWWFGAPLAGSAVAVAGVVAMLVVASLGIGFMLSALARSDSQAIQFAMLVLLASLFLSGFFVSTARLEPAAQWVGAALPVTHAIDLLREVMFLGTITDPGPLWLLAGLSIGYAAVAWMLGSRRLAAS